MKVERSDHSPTSAKSAAAAGSRRLWDAGRLADPHRQHDKASRVREMFDRIAPTYERVNTVASAGRDRAWRRRTVAWAAVQPTDRVLDIACGTGDLAEAFGRAGPAAVVAVDFAMQMLLQGRGRIPGDSGWCQGDALRLPFADHSFDIVSCAFGVRNFQDLQGGFEEMYRVLRPGGRALILEFSMPTLAPLKHLYALYFCRVMPRLATWMSGDHTGAYRYLPQSVMSFASPATMKDQLLGAGFESVHIKRQTFGVVNILRADRAATAQSAPRSRKDTG